MKKVSVIIPVYNSEPFIRQCVESVQNQTFDSLEIMIIDDGSVDGSLDICQKLQQSDDRIRIVSQENRGAATARNRGLDLAGGEYVFFLDSDDLIHPQLIEESVRQAKELQADLVMCRFVQLENRQIQKAWNMLKPEEGPVWELLEGKELEEQFHISKRRMLQRIGGLLVRRDCVGLQRFDEGLPYGEDTLFIYQLVLQGVRIAYSQQPWYYYRINPDSVSHQRQVIGSEKFLLCARRIRDSEAERGHLTYVLFWEAIFLYQIKRAFVQMKQMGDETGAEKLKREAEKEIRNPIFQKLSLRKRVMFCFCFYLTPLYILLNKLRPLYNKILSK